jgi:hypothetical protein
VEQTCLRLVDECGVTSNSFGFAAVPSTLGGRFGGVNGGDVVALYLLGFISVMLENLRVEVGFESTAGGIYVSETME